MRTRHQPLAVTSGEVSPKNGLDVKKSSLSKLTEIVDAALGYSMLAFVLPLPSKAVWHASQSKHVHRQPDTIEPPRYRCRNEFGAGNRGRRDTEGTEVGGRRSAIGQNGKVPQKCGIPPEGGATARLDRDLL